MKAVSKWNRVIPLLVFATLLVWGWRIGNPFVNITGYSDALEVIWGIEWYYKRMFQDHTSPFFTDRVFFPGGFYPATLNHTPALFLLAQPFRAIGGVAFAYNSLVLLAQIIIFSGAYRLLRIYVSRSIAGIAASMFVFWNFHWFRILGHPNILFMLSLSVWMTYFLICWRNSGLSKKRIVILNGIIWGIKINFSLYGIFIGGLITLLIGGRRGIGILLWSSVIALFLGSLTILLYYDGASKSQFSYFGATHSAYWGASLNSLIVPSVDHPVEQIRNWSRAIYSGPYDESGIVNIGFVTLFLALIGTITILKREQFRSYSHLFLLSIVGFILAIGSFLRWNGNFVSICALEPITSVIWKIGQTLKPQLFDTALPPEFRCAIPLPSLLLNATVPFWEGGRVASRYAIVAVLGLIPIAAIGLTTMPSRIIRVFLALLWILEFLPYPVYSVPLPTQPHPAYTQVSRRLQAGESVIEVYAYGLRVGGEILYNSLITDIQTVSGSGSFYPIHTIPIWQYLLNSSIWTKEVTADMLRQYGVRFVLVYRLSESEDNIIAMMKQNARFHFEQCFSPLPQTSPWNFPICVFRIKEGNDHSIVLFRAKGWSVEEEWGIWAEGTQSEIIFMLSRLEDLQMYIDAIPLCVPKKQQTITIFINGLQLTEHNWQNCDTLSRRIIIPASMLHMGPNKITFKYAYAASPIEITNGKNRDHRLLSVGFLKLEVDKMLSEKR